MSYDLHSEFNVEQHAKKYPYYTEVLILKNGSIVYAVPSHQIKMIELLVKEHNIKSRKELDDMCPREYWLDYNRWLCNELGCIVVWYDAAMFPLSITTEQKYSLELLRAHKCYTGPIFEGE